MIHKILSRSLLSILSLIYAFSSFSQDCLTFDVSSNSATIGEQVCVDVSTRDFESILAMQYTINWDSTALRFSSLENFSPNVPGLVANVFGTPDNLGIDKGTITLAWFDSFLTGVTVADGEVLFSVCFEVLASESEIAFSNTPTPIQIIKTPNNEIASANFINGKISTTEPTPLLQITETCLNALSCGTSVDFLISGGVAPYTYEWSGPNFSSNEMNPSFTQAGFYTLTITDAAGSTTTASFEIEDNAITGPIEEVIITNACSGAPTGAIELTLTDNGGAGYEFFWSNGSTTEDLNNIVADAYTVSITDLSANCTYSETFNVPVTNFSPILTFECTDYIDEVFVDITAVVWGGGVAPYTFEWSTGEIQEEEQIATITVNANGTYGLTVTDASGCFQTIENINPPCELPSNELEVSWSYECLDDNYTPEATINAFVWDGTPPYSFEWSNGETETTSSQLATITVPYPGTYSFTVTDANGNAYMSSDITPSCNPSNFLTASSYSCNVFEDSTLVDLNVVVWDGGEPPYTFEWSNGFTQVDSFYSTINYLCPASFDLTITDANGVSDVLLGLSDECECSAAEDALTFSVSSAEGFLGSSNPCVEVSVENFNDITAFQASIAWGTEIISFVEVNDFDVLDGMLFGTNTEGRLTLSWLNSNVGGVNLPDDEVLFEICFSGVSTGLSPVQVINSPTPIEAINSNLENVAVLTNDGNITISLATALGINCLPETEEVEIEVLVLEFGLDATYPPYTFEWSTGDVQVSETPFSEPIVFPYPGTYAVTVSNFIGQTVILDDITPDCESATEFVTASAYECMVYEDSTVVDLSVVVWDGGTQPYTFEWSNGYTEVDSFLTTLTYTCPGTFDLTITDANGESEVLQNLTDDCECGASSDALTLAISSEVGAVGEISCVDVSVANFNDMLSLQGSIEWDNSIVEFDAVNDVGTVSGLAFGTNNAINAGVLSFLWLDEDIEGVSLNDDDVLFEICFSGLAEGESPVSVVDAPTSIEAINLEMESVPVETLTGSITIGSASIFTTAYNYECVVYEDSTVVDLNVVVWGGGTQPYTFEWSNGYTEVDSFLTTLTYTCPGTFDLTITDADGVSEVLQDLTDDCECGASIDALTLAISSEQGEVGEISCVDVSVANFNDMLSLQGSIEWDNSIVEFDAVNDIGTVSGLNFGTNNAMSEGVLTFVWLDEGLQGVSLNDDDVLFEICFSGLAEGESPVSVVDSPTPIQAVNLEMEVIPVERIAGSVSIGSTSIFTTGFAYECMVFEDSTVVDLSVVVWGGGTQPYTFEWSNGYTEVDSFLTTLTYTCPGTFDLTITDADGVSEVINNLTDDCECGDDPEPDVEFSIPHEVGETGANLCIPIKGNQLTDIVGMQFSILYNPMVASLQSVEPLDLPNLAQINFGFVEPGIVTMSWFDPSLSGVNLPNDVDLFELCFEIVGDIGSSTPIEISNEPTPIEISDVNDNVLSFDIMNGSITVAENVWPGDTDNSELVNHRDLLNIGLGFGQTGPARLETGFNWQGYAAFDWAESTPWTNVNYKNADTNGDGIVSSADADAILPNYGEETNLWEEEAEEELGGGPVSHLSSPPIFVQPDTVTVGQTVSFPIMLGNESFPAADVYGIAFSILYDPEVIVPESVSASFEDSWIGTLENDMLALHKDFHGQGRIDIALTKIDGINVDGNGQIGALHLTIEDVILLALQYPTVLEIVNVRAITNSEEEITITPRASTIVIDLVNNVSEINLAEQLDIYPNPVANQLFINSSNVKIQNVKLYTLEGSLVIDEPNFQGMLSLSNLSEGMYLLKVATDKGIYHQRIVRQGTR